MICRCLRSQRDQRDILSNGPNPGLVRPRAGSPLPDGPPIPAQCLRSRDFPERCNRASTGV